MAQSLRSLRQVATLRLRFTPAFRALGVCEHIWPFSLRDIWATLLSSKWAEIFVAQMAGDETSLPSFLTPLFCSCPQYMFYVAYLSC